MIDKIKGVFPQFGSVSNPQQVQKVGFKPAGEDYLSKASASLTQKYNSQPVDYAAFNGAREKFLNGRSLLQEGALGNEGAVNGTGGAKLNFFA
ncbi:MAG: hypothetical protein A2104_03530 [Candidatus Melainabacteria bacterium GWF2_32_7]|nr:MAG: hypothetical protein A2104_03530 [Candidatus Melainabacteria bacterium GWF2_32_7]